MTASGNSASMQNSSPSQSGDNNHTSLGPHKIGVVVCGFVFMSDQICSEDYLVTGSIIRTYFSHGFGVFSCIFGVYPRLQWFPKLYTNVPILWNIDAAWKCYGNQCSDPSNSSTLHDSATEPMF